MTHKDIYTKFMIEYDKANVTSSYPSLTEYEVATVLDKAYFALIAQKVTGNNVRRVALEGDLKNIQDIVPLITTEPIDNSGEPPKIEPINALNAVKCPIPTDLLYFISAELKQNVSNPQDQITTRSLPVKLVNHEVAKKFITSAYNLPWVKIPVAYMEDDTLYIIYDSINKPKTDRVEITYVKKPNLFVKDLSDPDTGWVSYFDWGAGDAPDAYQFECGDTMAEELISLAITFALENVESQRLNTKLNIRGLEA